MKILRTLTLFCIILSAVAIGCSKKVAHSGVENPKQLVVATEASESKFQCPMKCQGDTAYTTNGQCPVCKMNLQKIK